jgi:hypothetical protein
MRILPCTVRIEGDVVAVVCDGEILLYDLLPSSSSAECPSLVATRAPSRTVPRVESEIYGCYDVCVAMRGRLLVAIYGCDHIVCHAIDLSRQLPHHKTN